MSSAGALAERYFRTSLALMELQQRYTRLKTQIGRNSWTNSEVSFLARDEINPLRQLSGQRDPVFNMSHYLQQLVNLVRTHVD